ncbi:hypothetical protein KIPB_004104 [Kipferlia bialata]|uniref:Uncharacterized protein n=1 Tax=Kipferlia bialata TaxID=797122 RepID=A0A9K3CUT7_9EUKA|nr:hypothetical protein KIPB_004104 [Kipferlia bialata]|eukprot:g4104.t1
MWRSRIAKLVSLGGETYLAMITEEDEGSSSGPTKVTDVARVTRGAPGEDFHLTEKWGDVPEGLSAESSITLVGDVVIALNSKHMYILTLETMTWETIEAPSQGNPYSSPPVPADPTPWPQHHLGLEGTTLCRHGQMLYFGQLVYPTSEAVGVHLVTVNAEPSRPDNINPRQAVQAYNTETQEWTVLGDTPFPVSYRMPLCSTESGDSLVAVPGGYATLSVNL